MEDYLLDYLEETISVKFRHANYQQRKRRKQFEHI
jgi:hypothetical protein